MPTPESANEFPEDTTDHISTRTQEDLALVDETSRRRHERLKKFAIGAAAVGVFAAAHAIGLIDQYTS